MAFLGGSFEPVEPVGNTIAKTLGDTLKSLAHHKLNQKHSQELEKLGFPKELASIFHKLDPKVQEGIFKQVDLSRIGQLQQHPQQQMQAQQNQLPTFTPEQVDYIKSIPDSNERQRVAQQFQVQNSQQQYQPQQQVSPNQQFGQAAAQQQIAQQLSQQQNPNSIFKQPEQPGNDLLAKEEIASQTRKKIVAEKYYEEKLNQGEEAERKLSILNQMETLVKDLSGQRTSNIARLSGNTILTTSPETQAFDKFAADLLPMGLTEEQLRSERQKFPNSGLSATANKRLIKDLKNKYIKEVSESNTAQAIVDANGGQLPTDFRKQLHYATKPEVVTQVKKKESKPVELREEDQEESAPESLLRNTVSAGVKSISDIVQLPGLPGKLAEVAEENPENISSHLIKNALNHFPELKAAIPISKAIGKGVDHISEGINKLTNNYLKPKNETEEVVQDYASMIPLYVLGGGAKTLSGVAGFLGKTVVGRAAGSGLENLGLGKAGKIIGEIGVPSLFEIVNLNNMKKHFQPLREKTYENLPGIAGEHKVDASEIKKALHIVNKEAQTRKHSDVIFKNLEHAEGLIENGQIPLKDLQPLKAKLNKAIYYDRLDALEPVLESVKNTSKLHPEYAKELHKADKLHSFIIGLDDKIDEAKDFIKDTISSIPVTKKYAVKKGAKILLDNPKVSAAGSLHKLYKDLPDQAGKYAIEALQAATKKQSGALISSLNKLGQLIERNEKDE